MAEVASEPLVAEAGANVLVARDEPPLTLGVVEHACTLAQPAENRVRIRQESRIGRVERDFLAQLHRWDGTARGGPNRLCPGSS